MKAEELVIDRHPNFGGSTICEHCVHLLVTDKPKILLFIGDAVHVFGEVVFVVGKWFGMLILGIAFLIEAVFPHLGRAKSEEELEAERRQKEWEDERDARFQESKAAMHAYQDERDARARDNQRARVDAYVNAEAVRLNSLTADFVRSSDSKMEAEAANRWNKIVESMNSSDDPTVDQANLRNNAVEIENLRQLEAARNARRRQLNDERNYHLREMSHWNERAHSSSDSREVERCVREADHHHKQALHANSAYENI